MAMAWTPVEANAAETPHPGQMAYRKTLNAPEQTERETSTVKGRYARTKGRMS
jgi:hypothetical protein